MRNGNALIIQKDSSNLKENEMIAYLLYIGEQISKLFGKLQNSYGSDLEQYIISHNPSCSADVERLTAEYNTKNSRGFL